LPLRSGQSAWSWSSACQPMNLVRVGVRVGVRDGVRVRVGVGVGVRVRV